MGGKDSEARYVSGHGLAQMLKIAFGLLILVTAAGALSSTLQALLVDRALSGQSITSVEAQATDERQQLIGMIQVVLYLASSILFLMWFRRAHSNLPALGAQGLKYSSNWAVAAFFVPVIGLFRPYQIMKEVWWKSNQESSCTTVEPKRYPEPPLVRWWWSLFLVNSLVGNGAGRLISQAGESLEELLTASWILVLSDVVGLVAAIATIRLILAVDAMQEEKRKELSLTNVGLRLVSP